MIAEAFEATVTWLGEVAGVAAHLTTDSRSVEAGDVFCAYPGATNDGRAFIGDAIARGASAVLWDPVGSFAWDPAWPVPQRAQDDLKQSCGPIAAAWYGYPSQRLWSVGVTGTSGKSSSTLWIAQAAQALGRRPAVVGTLGAGPLGSLQETGHTTPDPVRLQRLLSGFVNEGIDFLVMEVSSIGLVEGRVNGMHFDMALFCNLSRDHLDYHGTMAAYEAAKSRLFAWPGLRYAIINLDDVAGVRMAEIARSLGVEVYGFGLVQHRDKFLWADGLAYGANGMSFDVHGPFGARRFATPLIGTYNVYNLLGVMAALMVCGAEVDVALGAMDGLTPAPGRLERVGGVEGPMVLVDYAHKPDALEKAILACRPLAEARGGRLIVVFGCGGDRDPGKRPVMGAIASRLADLVIVTSDNPRSEDPGAIAQAILGGALQDRAQPLLELDRGAAISHAIGAAQTADLVLIAGKGHETYQETRGEKRPFSDLEEARRSLAAFHGARA